MYICCLYLSLLEFEIKVSIQLSLARTLSAARWSDSTNLQKLLLYLRESVLMHNTLQTLDLSHCCLDSRNFEPLATMQSCLQSLTLDLNQLGQYMLHSSTAAVVSACPVCNRYSRVFEFPKRVPQKLPSAHQQQQSLSGQQRIQEPLAMVEYCLDQ